MFSNRREAVLAKTFIVCLVLGFGYDALDRFWIQPIGTAQAEVQQAQDRNRQLQLDLQLVERAQKNLRSMRSQSLPDDTSVATLLYQEWLLERVRDARLRDAVVTPGRPIAEQDVGHRIPFTVQATAELRHIGRFLDDFYRTPVLHRITFLSVNNAGDSSSMARNLTLSLEALALEGAPLIDEIPSIQRSTIASATNLERVFARRDPFHRVRVIESKPKVPVAKQTPPPAKPKPKVDPLQSTRLVASVTHNGRREAWLFDARTQREIVVTVGDDLDIAEFSARITDINSSSITFSHKEQIQVTQLGETLRESLNKLSP